MIYSYSCALSIENKLFVRQLYYSFLWPASPYSEANEISTFINPVTPPIFTLRKPPIKFAKPSGSGVVPTSRRTQYSGLKYLQKP